MNLDEFVNLYEKHKKRPSKKDAIEILTKDEITEVDYIKLLNCYDLDVLEVAARKAKDITERYFGKNIFLYAPLYISNFCSSGCIYCGYSCFNKIKRKRLNINEIEDEMKALKKKGFQTILILTGEDNTKEGFNHLKDAVRFARRYFSEVLIETSPLTLEGYMELVNEGLTGVTLYQETYDLDTYKKVHLLGKKRDFKARLCAIERAIEAGVREVNIGCLLGLCSDYLKDVFLLSMHAMYLLKKYSKVELSISFPRIRPFKGMKFNYTEVSDLELVKFIVYTRLFLKSVGINISTRERSDLRDNLIGLGVTKMSAESKTSVGGYSKEGHSFEQFEVSDKRSLDEIIKVIRSKGYNAEFTNWVMI